MFNKTTTRGMHKLQLSKQCTYKTVIILVIYILIKIFYNKNTLFVKLSNIVANN